MSSASYPSRSDPPIDNPPSSRVVSTFMSVDYYVYVAYGVWYTSAEMFSVPEDLTDESEVMGCCFAKPHIPHEGESDPRKGVLYVKESLKYVLRSEYEGCGLVTMESLMDPLLSDEWDRKLIAFQEAHGLRECSGKWLIWSHVSY